MMISDRAEIRDVRDTIYWICWMANKPISNDFSRFP